MTSPRKRGRLAGQGSASGGSPDARQLGARHHFYIRDDPDASEMLIGWLS
jgi:hypothetical protein